MDTIRQTILGIFILLSQASPSWGGEQIWKAGRARVDITPQQSTWMAGYALRESPSKGVLTNLWAKALALEDAQGNRAVLVTADLLGFPKDLSDEIRDYAGEKYGLDRSRIILSASHTHSGPVLGDALYFIYPMTASDRKVVYRYTDHLKKLLVGLIDAAMKDLQPARISTGNGLARFAVNRRNNNAAALTSTTELKGPHDHAVPVLKVEGPDGTVKVILFGYACHPTTLSGMEFCGDYPGFAQIELEKMYPGATAMFFQGAGADQNPLPRNKVSLAIQYGRQLAASVGQVLSEEMILQESSLKTRYEEIELPLDAPLPREELLKLAEGSDYQARWAKGMLGEGEKAVPALSSYPYPIAYWTIGTQKLFILGGEVVSGYSVRLKQHYGDDVFVMGYANDVMTYIPTTVIWDEGRYEGATAPRVYALPSRWTRDVEEIIFNAIGKIAGKQH